MLKTTKIKKGRAVYIVDGARTPFLKAGAVPGPFTAGDLGVNAGRALLLRQPFAPSELDEVITGCVMPRPEEANISRIISLRLGCGKKVPAWTVQRNCASGMQSIDSAAQRIAHGYADLIMAGGTEAMSHAPLIYNDKLRHWLGNWSTAKTFKQKLAMLAQLRPGHLAPVVGLLKGLTDPVVGLSMGQTAENIAHRFDISREAMDAFSLRSHQRLAAAIDEGRLGEVIALYDAAGKLYTEDTGLRRDSSLEKLAKLKPIFDKSYGKVTAGNSSQVTDGAAYVILASEQAVKHYQLPTLGRIIQVNWAGLDAAQMGLGPVHATAALLKSQKLAMSDIDYWEINEAFAGQVLACIAAWNDADYCQTELGLKEPLGLLDQDHLNIDGGAVAIGHPVGTSGARLILRLLRILERKQARYGVATLCIGGGQGGATLIERGEV